MSTAAMHVDRLIRISEAASTPVRMALDPTGNQPLPMQGLALTAPTIMLQDHTRGRVFLAADQPMADPTTIASHLVELAAQELGSWQVQVIRLSTVGLGEPLFHPSLEEPLLRPNPRRRRKLVGFGDAPNICRPPRCTKPTRNCKLHKYCKPS